MAVSLYESGDGQNHFIGDPVADSLAVVTRQNCGILALADGVSWGQKSKLASNCGIYGSVKYLCEHINDCVNTKDVFRCILRGFESAQKCIVEEEATMTTLCVGVVVQLQEKDCWGLCVVNVGDSYAYIYNKRYGVKEVTHGSHPIDEMRDMRFSGGALGPADGYNPDLENLTCSFVVLGQGDLVFLCSDGISDNFDPAVAKFTPRFKASESQSEIDGYKVIYKRDIPDSSEDNDMAKIINSETPDIAEVEDISNEERSPQISKVCCLKPEHRHSIKSVFDKFTWTDDSAGNSSNEEENNSDKTVLCDETHDNKNNQDHNIGKNYSEKIRQKYKKNFVRENSLGTKAENCDGNNHVTSNNETGEPTVYLNSVLAFAHKNRSRLKTSQSDESISNKSIDSMSSGLCSFVTKSVVKEADGKNANEVSQSAIQTLTPRERQRGMLEQMTEVGLYMFNKSYDEQCC